MPTLRDVFEERLSTFDTDMVWNEEQDSALRALDNTGEIISIIVGERGAAVSMAALRALLTDAPVSLDNIRKGEGLDFDWRADGFNAEMFSVWPEFFSELRALHSFAELGIFAPWAHAKLDTATTSEPSLIQMGTDLPRWIHSICERSIHIMKLAPESDGAPYDKLWTIVLKAQARLKYDEGHMLTPEDLAHLSEVTVKRIQNASYEGGTGAPVIDKKGLITPDSAREWLTRKNFKFSIWTEIVKLLPLDTEWGRDIFIEQSLIVNDGFPMDNEIEEDYVFIPVAADQSRFLPTVKRANGYQIGAKGAELPPIEDYFDALEKLSKQGTPHWRRPSEKGNWGIVAGRSWERVRRNVLQDQITQLTKA